MNGKRRKDRDWGYLDRGAGLSDEARLVGPILVIVLFSFSFWRSSQEANVLGQVFSAFFIFICALPLFGYITKKTEIDAAPIFGGLALVSMGALLFFVVGPLLVVGFIALALGLFFVWLFSNIGL